MENRFKMVACAALLTMTVSAVRAQNVKLPKGLDLDKTERTELVKYCNSLSRSEKFLLMTTDSLTDRFSDNEKEENSAETYRKNFMNYVNAIKDSNCVVDKGNGYLNIAYGNSTFFRGAELTYWNVTKDKQLIATRTITGICCDTETYGKLRFYICENGETRRVPIDQVFDEPVRWYEVYSLESYLSMEFAGIHNSYFEETYELPRKGKDIKVSPVPIGCGPCSQNYSVYYRWNGDGTFTKVSSQMERLEGLANMANDAD